VLKFGKFLPVQNCKVKGPKGGQGIDGADFVFYISAMETERCQKGMTVAYAAHCQQEAALDRWVACLIC
jgi:leishmanolysin-like peptidase